MENIKQIIAKNLVELRKQNKLTQLELAERLNYSDKAVSRWERGDALPDIDVLCKICEMYGVTFDYLTHEGDRKEKSMYTYRQENGNKIVIALLAVITVWFMATFYYVYQNMLFDKNMWKAFVWAVPLSAIVGIVFSSLWGKRSLTLTLVSVLIWGALAAFYVQFLDDNLWMVFLLGAPLQVAVILWANLGKKRLRKEKKGKKESEPNLPARIRKKKVLEPEKMLEHPPEEGAESEAQKEK